MSDPQLVPVIGDAEVSFQCLLFDKLCVSGRWRVTVRPWLINVFMT